MIVTSRHIQISRRLVQTMQQSATARIIRNSSSYVDTKWYLSENNPYTLDDYQRIQGHLMDRIKWRPRIGIICGSGLGGLADRINDARKVSYQDIPGFPVNTAPGHAGQFVFGMLSGKPVMCMQGRFHLYEGYQPWQLTIPIRVMKLLGVHTLIVTNAAGSLHPEYNVGDVMVIKDHINMPGLVNFNPLCGPNINSFGPRFPSLCNAYDWDLRHDLFQVAKALHLENIMREGIYCTTSGPNFGTPAEHRFLRLIGSDAVGMSTCHEVVVARHCGMRVLGMSLISDQGVLDYETEEGSIPDEVLRVGRERAIDLQKLVAAFVDGFDEPAVPLILNAGHELKG